MAEVRFSPAAALAYNGLEKAACRKRSFSGGLWGIPVRDRHDDWLIVREHDLRDSDIIRVRYIGADPFA